MPPRSRPRLHTLSFALALVVILLRPAAPAVAQPPADFPTATTVDALTRYPTFYHLKAVVVRGRISMEETRTRLLPPVGTGVERGVDVLRKDRRDNLPDGIVEVRGQFLDVGRLSHEDPHTATLELGALVQSRYGDRWPAQGEMLVLNPSSVTPVPPPPQHPSLRQLALDPLRYEGQPVTLVGQFAGRNLLGDLPQAPRRNVNEFVIRNAGGAVWVSGIEPQGRGWRLNPSLKLDTDRWLKVQGLVRQGNGLVWIEAKSVERTDPQAAAPEPGEEAPKVLPAPPPEVLFTLPAAEETDVPPGTTVKIQTSRDLDPATFDKHIVVAYVGQEATAPPVLFKATFERSNRVLELTFERPLERFRTVKVDVLDGVKGTDGQPLRPFTLTFTVGGEELTIHELTIGDWRLAVAGSQSSI